MPVLVSIAVSVATCDDMTVATEAAMGEEVMSTIDSRTLQSRLYSTCPATQDHLPRHNQHDQQQ